jgi:hypothetical protein
MHALSCQWFVAIMQVGVTIGRMNYTRHDGLSRRYDLPDTLPDSELFKPFTEPVVITKTATAPGYVAFAMFNMPAASGALLVANPGA